MDVLSNSLEKMRLWIQQVNIGQILMSHSWESIQGKSQKLSYRVEYKITYNIQIFLRPQENKGKIKESKFVYN